MATRRLTKSNDHSSWPLFAGLGGIAILVLVVVIWFGTRSQPQLAVDEDVFNTVDALFTAVTSRDSQRLAVCEERLEKYAAEGRLAGSAASALETIVEEAKSGDWEPAAKKLYSFMLGQRREG